jgi:hypothetical protein
MYIGPKRTVEKYSAVYSNVHQYAGTHMDAVMDTCYNFSLNTVPKFYTTQQWRLRNVGKVIPDSQR